MSRGETIQLDDGPAPTPGGPGKGTSEFAATLTVVVTNVVAVLVLLGIVASKDQAGLTDMVNAVIGAVAVAVPNVVGLWAYVRARVELKRSVGDNALAREELRLGHELNLRAVRLQLKQAGEAEEGPDNG